MKLPQLDQPQRYAGLYIFDFGDQVSVGHTAAEVAALLDQDEYRNGKVYQIYRAYPDGTMELRGVAAESFTVETGMFFYRHDEQSARQDWQQLVDIAAADAPPCRASWELAAIDAASGAFVCALLYPAEYDQAMAQWLLTHNYQGGTTVEGGQSLVADYRDRRDVLDRRQFWGADDKTSRPAGVVLRTVRQSGGITA